ncbi:MAG: hypothetical protein IPM17_13290 [Verrucomicrobia bacterium]|jgi:hypothetical protein|nr:hypothetical protein [Verrucomicrobiota bacterium]
MKRALAGGWIVLPWVAWLALGCQMNRESLPPAESSAHQNANAALSRAADAAAPPRVAAPQFELSDQFGTNHSFHFPRDKITVVTVCGRKGSDEVAPWTTALGQRFGETIFLQGVADVGGVPGFMRGVIRAMFRKEIKYPVLLDWSGAHSAAFQYDRPSVTVYVVDRQGWIVHRAGGPATPEALGRVIKAVEDLLPNTGSRHQP